MRMPRWMFRWRYVGGITVETDEADDEIITVMECYDIPGGLNDAAKKLLESVYGTSE